MKSYISKFSLLFFLSFIISSCGCKVLKFEKDETFWTDIYNQGDTIIYKSDSEQSEIDTIFITKKDSYFPTGDCNPMVSNFDSQGCVIDYKYKHNGKKLSDYDYLIQHVKEEDDISIPTLRVYGLEYSRPILKDTTLVLKAINLKLKDCYVFHDKDCYRGWSEFKLKLFIWSKSKGLVMFQGQDGKKYEFVKKINQK